ncbi:hypothetical protein KO361_01035 [Candidatus Woesearchaeota archaeon]|nr:hypothetical protein [Candidatus Woesearchaeota archaeon]
MNKIEQRIIQALTLSKNSDISTTVLVKSVFPSEYEELVSLMNNPQRDFELVKIGKRNKARLHRKLLYHLNKLSEDDFIKITRVVGKGEKFFCLNHEKIVLDKKDFAVRRVVESISSLKDDVPFLSGIEEYEDDRVVKRFDSQNWLTKINSFVLECSRFQSIKKLYETLSESYPIFNDVVGLLDFQDVVDKSSVEEQTNFLRKINIDTKDYNKYVNLVFDLTKVRNYVRLSDFFDVFSEVNPDKVFVIFQTNSKTLSGQNRLISSVVKNFSEKKIRVNVQNVDLHKAPYMIGRAGAYTFDEQDWELYCSKVRGKTIGVCCSETSIYIDIYRSFKDKVNYSAFRELIMKIARALLLATSTQRKKSDSLFRPVNKLNQGFQSKFFSFSYNYIRLWNYDLLFSQEQDKDSGFVIFNDLLMSAVDELDEFCKSEETIFRSCGIPIRFKIVLSSAFRRFDKDFLSPRIYKKVLIKSLSDYYSDIIVRDIRRRESLYKVFRGGDRVRFFRDSRSLPEEIISEFHFLLTNHYLPFFTYDFRSLSGEVTLDSFFR